MAQQPQDRATTERRLWDEIQRHQIGMLGVVGGPSRHFQPMTAFAEPDANRIWFFSRDDTDLARDIDAARTAMFIVQAKGLQACIRGELALERDRARIDKYWNAVVAAWYPQGRDDPHLTLIRMDCGDADVWISDVGPMRFAWEIVRANATHREPDVGGRANLSFH